MFAAMGEVRRFAVADGRIMELVTRDESAVLTLRWEATGPGGQAVPGPGRRDHANPRRAARHAALARPEPAALRCVPLARDPASRSCTGQRQRHTSSFRNRAADALAPGPGRGRWRVRSPGHHGLRQAPGSTRNALA